MIRRSTLLVLALPLLAAQPARAGESPAAIRAIVDSAVRTAPDPRSRALTELRRLDPSAVPALLQVYTGRDLRAAESDSVSEEPRFEVPPPPAWLGDVVLDALDHFDGQEVERALERFARDAELEERLSCLRVAERLGGHRAVDAWIALLAGIAPIRLNSSFVSAPAERALTTIVNGAPRSAERLSQRLGDVQEGLYPCLARAAGASGKRTSLPLLAALFGRGSELDLVVLRETGRLGTADSDDPLGLRFVSNALRNPDPRYRAESVVALARLGCLWEIDGVIGALEDADRRVSQAALWALRHLSGNEWGAEASRWSSWWESERAWSEARLEDAVRELATGDPAERLRALDELALHRVWSAHYVQALTDQAARAEGPFAERARALLAELGVRP